MTLYRFFIGTTISTKIKKHTVFLKSTLPCKKSNKPSFPLPEEWYWTSSIFLQGTIGFRKLCVFIVFVKMVVPIKKIGTKSFHQL